MMDALAANRAALRRTMVARNRLEANRARTDTRSWVMKRRERTRQLIELGGLIAKAGLIELTDDDRAVIFGALIEAAARLRSKDRDQALVLWRRRGRRAFEDSEAN
jgi:Conjugal transfer protein TraD